MLGQGRAWVIGYAAAGAIPVVTTVAGLLQAGSVTVEAWGFDFRVMLDAARQWLSDGSPYRSFQLEGPYSIHGPGSQLAVLYPPTFMLVATPFLLLPDHVASTLWVAAPVVVTAWTVLQMRPAPPVWPLLGLLVAYPLTGVLVAAGNPTMAATAVLAVALQTRRRWLAALLLLKPTIAPFSLLGADRRPWWLAVVGLGLLSIPFGELWLEWWTAVWNAQDGGLLYSLPHYPVLLIPVITAAARRDSSRLSPSQTAASLRSSATASS